MLLKSGGTKTRPGCLRSNKSVETDAQRLGAARRANPVERLQPGNHFQGAFHRVDLVRKTVRDAWKSKPPSAASARALFTIRLALPTMKILQSRQGFMFAP